MKYFTATKLLVSILLATFISCTNSSNNSDSNGELQTNACNVLSLSNKTHTRIVNGTACGNLDRSPVVRVALINSLGLASFCSGTMITPGTVITAAHCFLNIPSQVVILSGRTVESATEHKADSWLIHPGFRPQGNRAIKDVAIIRLVNNINLPTVALMTEQKSGKNETVSIFGYGKDENGNFDFEELKSGEMKISEVDRTHVIAKFDGAGSNTCQGDSGGPLLSTRSGKAAIAGITSSGLNVDCGEGDTSFFTNIADPDVAEFLKTNVPGAEYL